MDILKYLRNQKDRVGSWVAIALGGIALTVGWFGVSGTPLPSEQLPYIISGGLGGFFLLGLGAVLWLSADLRDEWRKLDDLDRRWEALEAASGPVRRSINEPTEPDGDEVPANDEPTREDPPGAEVDDDGEPEPLLAKAAPTRRRSPRPAASAR